MVSNFPTHQKYEDGREEMDVQSTLEIFHVAHRNLHKFMGRAPLFPKQFYVPNCN